MQNTLFCTNDRGGRDRMVVGFTTTYAIGAYRCLSVLWVRLSPRARSTTVCDKVCQCQWFFPSPPVSSINKTDRHNITEILLKVVLNTIKPNKTTNDRFHELSPMVINFILCHNIFLISDCSYLYFIEFYK